MNSISTGTITWPPSLKPNWRTVPVPFYCFYLHGCSECAEISCFDWDLRNNTMLLWTDNFLSNTRVFKWKLELAEEKLYLNCLRPSYTCTSISAILASLKHWTIYQSYRSSYCMLGMGDTSFFIRFDISSIFAFFFDIDIDIDIFPTRTTITTKDYF